MLSKRRLDWSIKREVLRSETGENNPHRSLDILLRLIDKERIDLDDVKHVMSL